MRIWILYSVISTVEAAMLQRNRPGCLWMVCCLALLLASITQVPAQALAQEILSGADPRIAQLTRLLERARSNPDPISAYAEEAGVVFGIRPETASDSSTPSLKGRPTPAERGSARRGNVRSDWTPYDGPFGVYEAAHLLHRGVIGPRYSEMADAAATGLGATIADLLSPSPPPTPPGPWALEPLPDIGDFTPEQIDSLVALYAERMEILRLWWGDVIVEATDGPEIRESMVLFWHDHFATGGSGVILPQSMYLQNTLLRQHALGSFRDLVRGIYKDPAMLLWLNGNQNVAGNLNENFARELLELFTLGLDQYTQDDIVAAAKSFTGWLTYDGVTSDFYPEYHDTTEKTFLGPTGNWDGDDIVDFIFEEDEVARFICRKLYRWYIDEYPDEPLIEDLAQTFRANNYRITPVLDRMLRSSLFFDENYRGAIISDGIDRSLGAMRSLHIEDVVLMDSMGEGAGLWAYYGMFLFGQILFEPPNVAGWPGYRTWINATTLPYRKLLDVGIVDGNVNGYDIAMQLDAIAWANTLSDPNDAYQLIDDVALTFFGMTPTELVRQRMLDELLQGSEPWEWSLSDPDAESRVQGLVRLAMRLPDFQLK